MIIKSKELSKALKEKEKLVNDGRDITKQIEKLEADRRKIGLQIQKIKDKVIPLVGKLMEGKLAEFEEISTVEPKGDDIDIQVINVVEGFKKDYLDAKAKK